MDHLEIAAISAAHATAQDGGLVFARDTRPPASDGDEPETFEGWRHPGRAFMEYHSDALVANLINRGYLRSSESRVLTTSKGHRALIKARKDRRAKRKETPDLSGSLIADSVRGIATETTFQDVGVQKLKAMQEDPEKRAKWLARQVAKAERLGLLEPGKGPTQ